jgi:CRP/FNR family transcriptional regulator
MDDRKSLFPGFNQDLYNLMTRISTRSFHEAGDRVLSTGQFIRSVAIVTKGKIKICREDLDGNEFFLYHLIPGQACAYTLSFEAPSFVCNIMAKAIEETEMWLIPLTAIQKWMTKYPCWNDFVIKNFHNHIHQLTKVMDLIIFKGMDERLNYYLQAHKKNGQPVRLQISHQEIANEMSTSREVISRLLKKMEQQGKVILHRNQIELIA